MLSLGVDDLQERIRDLENSLREQQRLTLRVLERIQLLFHTFLPEGAGSVQKQNTAEAQLAALHEELALLRSVCPDGEGCQ